MEGYTGVPDFPDECERVFAEEEEGEEDLDLERSSLNKNDMMSEWWLIDAVVASEEEVLPLSLYT